MQEIIADIRTPRVDTNTAPSQGKEVLVQKAAAAPFNTEPPQSDKQKSRRTDRRTMAKGEPAHVEINSEDKPYQSKAPTS